MRVTQQKLAEKLGLSRQAIGFAVSESPEAHRQLRPETRRRILETAQQMGYVPHNAARRLARTRMNSLVSSFDQIGLVYFNASGASLEPVCLTIMGGAEHELSSLHATLTFVRVGEDADWAKVDRVARSGGVDGWLIVGQVDDAVAERFQAYRQPFVIVGDSCCAQPIPHVDVDNFAAGYLAAKHLASLGHRRIAYLVPNMQFAYQRLMLNGFQSAVDELGLDKDERLFGHILNWELRDGIAMMEWLSRFETAPTAVFAPEISGTAELCRLIQSSRVRVPHDISFLGLGLTSPIRMNQGITKIELPVHEIGRQGVLLLHRLVSGSVVEKIEMKLPPTLTDEGTTASPASPRG